MSRPVLGLCAIHIVCLWAVCHDTSQDNVKVIYNYYWITTDKIFFNIPVPMQVVSLVYIFSSTPASSM